ncbi:MAG: LuxR C-terminal-related transcriptional regulator [Gemmobacter sp.]
MDALAAARAIGLAHAAAVDPRHWPEALRELCQALGAHTAACGFRGTDGRDWGAICPDTDPFWHRRYAEELHPHNHIWAAAMRASPGSALSGEAVPGPVAYRRSVIWNEFIAPQGMDATLTLVLARDHAGAALMSFGRARRREGFDTLELARAAGLARTLAAAAQTAVEGGATMFARQLDRVGAGTFVCDRAGRVRALSERAARLEAQGRARIDFGRLVIPGIPGSAAALDRATRPHRGEVPPMGTDLTARDGLRVRVAPWCGADTPFLPADPLAVVILEDAARTLPLKTLAERHGLTPREAAIAGRIVAGQSLREAADALGIALSTARTHLQRIFDKTDTRSQAALIRLATPPSWPDPDAPGTARPG